MGNAETFSRSVVFEGISEEAIEALCSRGQVLSFEAGHGLFERGQEARELMILQEGVVELLFPVRIMGVTRELAVESKHAGDVVAWSALVSPYRCTLGARCGSDCVLTSLKREVLEEFFRDDPQVGCLFLRNLAGVIGRRLQAMQNIWLLDLQTSAIKRLET
jgi:CRP-like cAMP-binding protein